MRRQSSGILMAACAAMVWVAGGEAKAQTATDTTDYLMAGFDFGSPQNTELGGYFYFYTDNNVATEIDTVFGNSALTSFPGGTPLYDTVTFDYDTLSYPRGRSGDSATRSLRLAYALGDRKLSCGTACSYPGFIGLGVKFSFMYDTVDMTTAKSISFWSRSDSDTVTVDVSVMTADDPANGAYTQTFKIGPQWKKYSINLVASAAFKQPSWVEQVPFNPARIKGMGWNVNRSYPTNDARPVNGIRLDNITIDGWTWVDPALGIRPLSRSAGARGWRLQIQGSQIRILRDGGRIPLNLNGRALAR